jgi:hypothetical protein
MTLPRYEKYDPSWRRRESDRQIIAKVGLVIIGSCAFWAAIAMMVLAWVHR